MAVPKKTLTTHVRHMVIFKGPESYSFVYCGQMPTIRDNRIKIEEFEINIQPIYKMVVSTINLCCDCGSQFILREHTSHVLPRLPYSRTELMKPNWNKQYLEMENVPLPPVPISPHEGDIDLYEDMSGKLMATAPTRPPNSPELTKIETQALLNNTSRPLSGEKKCKMRTFIHVPY